MEHLSGAAKCYAEKATLCKKKELAYYSWRSENSIQVLEFNELSSLGADS